MRIDPGPQPSPFENLGTYRPTNVVEVDDEPTFWERIALVPLRAVDRAVRAFEDWRHRRSCAKCQRGSDEP